MTTYINHRSAEYLETRDQQLKELTGMTRKQMILDQKKRELRKTLKK